jgi:hypothetical protein
MTDDHRTVAERQCRHSRTTYNEQDGTLYCEQCHSWMTDDAPRTVADVLTVASGRSALVLLHIDPDMPLDDWYRRLEMGERAEGLDPMTKSEEPGDWGRGFKDGWNAYDAIVKGET